MSASYNLITLLNILFCGLLPCLLSHFVILFVVSSDAYDPIPYIAAINIFLPTLLCFICTFLFKSIISKGYLDGMLIMTAWFISLFTILWLMHFQILSINLYGFYIYIFTLYFVQELVFLDSTGFFRHLLYWKK